MLASQKRCFGLFRKHGSKPVFAPALVDADRIGVREPKQCVAFPGPGTRRALPRSIRSEVIFFQIVDVGLLAAMPNVLSPHTRVMVFQQRLETEQLQKLQRISQLAVDRDIFLSNAFGRLAFNDGGSVMRDARGCHGLSQRVLLTGHITHKGRFVTSFSLVQIHHGISCTDIEQTKAVLRTIGFDSHQPGAPEPLTFRNVDGDFIGQVTAPVLGDEYHTHYVENSVTGQQIDLIEISAAALRVRDWQDPAQGDLIIGIQVDDPQAAYTAMRNADPELRYGEVTRVEDDGKCLLFDWRDQQRSILTTETPFAILHYSEQDFPRARRFYEEVLAIELTEIENSPYGATYRLEDIGGRLEIRVSATTRVLEFAEFGKRYPGANHFRLINQDIERIARRMEETALGGFIIPPANGFAFLRGPAGEAIETFDQAFGLPG